MIIYSIFSKSSKSDVIFLDITGIVSTTEFLMKEMFKDVKCKR